MAASARDSVALAAIHWLARYHTWDSDGSCRSDSCNVALHSYRRKRVARRGQRCGIVRCPAWRADVKAAFDCRTAGDRLGHAAERCRPLPASATHKSFMSWSMARAPSCSAFTVRWVETLVVAGELWPSHS